MRTQSHDQAVRQWCLSLVVLSAVRISRDEVETKLAAYAGLLAREFPAGAFTADSLAHVAAAAVKGFPTYGELVASLRVWWADHRPLPPMLEPPPPPPPRDPTPEELARIRALVEDMTARVRANADETVAGAPGFGPRYLSPGQLDAINPLPNGRKRVAA
jgi:hypothetical protein